MINEGVAYPSRVFANPYDSSGGVGQGNAAVRNERLCTMSTDEHNPIVLRGTAISQDAEGRICLDDLWEVAGASAGRKPRFWRITEGAKALVKVLQKKVGIPNIKGEVIAARRGRGMQGTFAHPIIAAAYAGYLDPNLEVEVREVWLRYRAGDATLADEILQRASAEANHWAGVRALSRARRRSYTDVLKAQGVVAKGYMECTEAVYINLLGKRSYELRAAMKLKPKTNLREHLDADKLVYIMAAETLAAERILDEQRVGNAECIEATAISASVFSTAIANDRRNRQKRLVA